MHPKGNLASKFQLARVRRFGGVREQTNKQTHSLIDRLALLYSDLVIIFLRSKNEENIIKVFDLIEINVEIMIYINHSIKALVYQ